jgi:hypothetical protein
MPLRNPLELFDTAILVQNSWLLHRSKTRRRSAQAKLEYRRRHLVVDCLNTKSILGRISQRGNRYLRMLFMQGARVILPRPENWQKHSFGAWLTAAAKRLHHNVLTTALSNKLARITWTVLAQGRSYEARVEPRTA